MGTYICYVLIVKYLIVFDLGTTELTTVDRRTAHGDRFDRSARNCERNAI